MKKKPIQLSQMAALHALGALDGHEANSFHTLLEQSTEAQTEAHTFGAVAEFLAKSLPRLQPPAGMKERLLGAAKKAQARDRMSEALQKMLPTARDGLAFCRNPAETGWVPLPVPGAFVKVLSFDRASEYAVVLGKLDAGARYPGHTHQHPEDIFMLSGDLHVGDQVLLAGDFHHAEAMSKHPVNWSERGCVLLCVLSKEDLANQLG